MKEICLKLFTLRLSIFSPIDKLQHVLGCAILTSLICSLPSELALFVAGPVVLLVGLGKEVYDYLHPADHTADIKDVYADTLGILIVLIPTFVQRYFA